MLVPTPEVTPTANGPYPRKGRRWLRWVPMSVSIKHLALAVGLVRSGYGPPREIRTPDTQVRSLVLYPAELWADGGSAEYMRLLVYVSYFE